MRLFRSDKVNVRACWLSSGRCIRVSSKNYPIIHNIKATPGDRIATDL